MKNMIVCMAITMLFLILLRYQSDTNQLARNSKSVQMMIEDAVLSASSLYDEEKYSKGQIVFEERAANGAYELVMKNLNKDYWKGDPVIEVTCYSEDKSDEKKVYSYVRDRGLVGIKHLPCKRHHPGIGLEIRNLVPNFKMEMLRNIDKNISRKALSIRRGYNENLESKME